MSAPASRLSDRRPQRLPLTGPGELPAQRLVRAPRPVRNIALAIAVAIPVIALLLLFMPWQQSATGSGRVIAMAPANRQQPIEAPIEGRLVEWFVQEGQVVKAGDPLVLLSDNDADWADRLDAQLVAAEQSASAAAQQVVRYEAKLVAQTAQLELTLAEYDAKIAGLLRKRVGEQAELEAAAIQADRVQTLQSEGIQSSRTAELAVLAEQKAAAAVAARDEEISATRRARDKAGADAEAKIAGVAAELEAARSKLAEAQQKELELEGEVSRQAAQRVTAPRDGIVLAVRGGPGGGQVKKGELLLTLVPQTDDRAVELWIDGNDMPLVQRGSDVRLLFEGWPALQFVGAPGGTTGTFAGKVVWIDAADNGEGAFRIVVEPDPDELPWPDPDRLRQGVRAKGFVLLDEVRLGYELWRQINGFPPLPAVAEGDKPPLPTTKKPRAPSELR